MLIEHSAAQYQVIRQPALYQSLYAITDARAAAAGGLPQTVGQLVASIIEALQQFAVQPVQRVEVVGIGFRIRPADRAFQCH